MLCQDCGKHIDDDRAEFIRLAKKRPTCIEHSNESKLSGLMDYGHKTAPQLVILPPNNKEIERIAKRAFRRAR